MQATLDSTGIKPFTRALTCLSKYGDDLTIYATPDSLSLSSTNSSMSAYARFKFASQFFVRYNVGDKKSSRDRLADGVQEVLTVTGQLLTKSLLSILKHRTVEKSVSRCELSVIEGTTSERDEDDSTENDTLESKLIVRLHCKHGVIKTHKLLLLTPTSLMAPGMPETVNESRLTIGPRSVKDMIEQFPSTKTVKNDPQLIWTFSHTDVHIKSVDSFFDSKAGAQLSTELTISADEFDVYDIYCPPITIAFHLREFNATIAFAESMALPLELRFTDPLSPLFIDVGDDTFESLYVISTSHVHGVGGGASASQARSVNANERKRGREEDELPAARNNKRPLDRRKPMKVVQRTDVHGYERAMGSGSNSSQPSGGSGSMPPPSLPPPRSPLFEEGIQPQSSARRDSSEPLFLPGSQLSQAQAPQSSARREASEPLFLPGSQMSQAQMQALKDSGLGLENMTAAELDEMFEGDDDELEYAAEAPVSPAVHAEKAVESSDTEMDEDSLSIYEELLPTQEKSTGGDKSFRPLFED